MSGKNPVLTPLAERKRLLLAESEINRQLLAHEWLAVTAGARDVTQKVRQVGGFAMSLTALAGGFSLFRKLAPKPAAQKPSLLSRVIQGMRLGMSLWAVFSAKRQQPV
jgi:hypothetical protein